MSVILRMLIILYNQTNTLKDIVIHLNIGLFISNPEQLQRRINVYRWVFRRGIPYFNGHDANLRQAQVCLRILRCGLSKRYGKEYCFRGSVSVCNQAERGWGFMGKSPPPSQPQPRMFLPVDFLISNMHLLVFWCVWSLRLSQICFDL